MNQVYVLGASGHGREVAAAVRAAATSNDEWKRSIEFLDDELALLTNAGRGPNVMGSLQDGMRGGAALLGVGYPEAKYRVLSKVEDMAYSWPTLVHPASTMGERIHLGRGCLVQAGCVLTCDIDVDEFVTLNVGATVSHDVRIGRLATCSPGSHIGGNVVVGEGVFVGIGASVRQGVVLGAWSVVGAGAVVVKDVDPNTVVAGVPAHTMDERKDGWHRGI